MAKNQYQIMDMNGRKLYDLLLKCDGVKAVVQSRGSNGYDYFLRVENEIMKKVHFELEEMLEPVETLLQRAVEHLK